MTPKQVTLSPGGTQQFTAAVTGASNTDVEWTVSTHGGTITTEGFYTAPMDVGTYYVTATSVEDPTKSAKATVYVTAGGPTGRNYTGTITISNTGTHDELTMDQSATLDVTISEVDYGDYPQFVLSTATVDAEVKDMQTGGDDIVYIQGSLSGATMSPPQSVVLIIFDESTYELLIGGVLLNCTMTGVPGTVLYAIPGKIITESLPADLSRLTGSITGPLEETPGITQTITWDLQANF